MFTVSCVGMNLFFSCKPPLSFCLCLTFYQCASQLLQEVPVLRLRPSRAQLQAQHWRHLLLWEPAGQHRPEGLRVGRLRHNLLWQHLRHLHALIHPLREQAPRHVHHLPLLWVKLCCGAGGSRGQGFSSNVFSCFDRLIKTFPVSKCTTSMKKIKMFPHLRFTCVCIFTVKTYSMPEREYENTVCWWLLESSSHPPKS